MSSQWYYQKKGEAKQGPFSDKELKAKAAAGEITPDGFVWKEGLKSWVPAGKIKGLFETRVAAPNQPTNQLYPLQKPISMISRLRQPATTPWPI